MSATTTDDFLGGKIRARQPASGYRAGTDPVFLAAACPAKPGDSVLELGCGVGVAILCLMARVPDLSVTALDLQHELADLARQNLRDNGLSAEIVTCDVAELTPDLRARSFDQVIANPPYFDRRAGKTADDPGRERGRGEVVPLADWIDVAVRRINPTGQLTLIQPTSRLPLILHAFKGRIGDIAIRPLASRDGRDADRMILTGRKGARAPFRLLAPLIVHDGETHARDGDDYSDTARAILRDGASLDAAILSNP